MLHGFGAVLVDDNLDITRALSSPAAKTGPLPEDATANNTRLEYPSCTELLMDEYETSTSAGGSPEPDPKEACRKIFRGGANTENEGYANETQGQADTRRRR